MGMCGWVRQKQLGSRGMSTSAITSFGCTVARMVVGVLCPRWLVVCIAKHRADPTKLRGRASRSRVVLRSSTRTRVVPPDTLHACMYDVVGNANVGAIPHPTLVIYSNVLSIIASVGFWPDLPCTRKAGKAIVVALTMRFRVGGQLPYLVST